MALLFPLDSNYFKIFAVDLMHEFELGVWKMTFKQLLSLLKHLDSTGLVELNKR